MPLKAKAEEALNKYDEKVVMDEAGKAELTAKRKQFGEKFKEWLYSVGKERALKRLKKVAQVKAVLLKEIAWEKKEAEIPEDQRILREYTNLENILNAGEDRFCIFSSGGGFLTTGF